MHICCNSYLPKWRKRNYKSIYSSDKKRGGGVHLDLSHEIDFANWIFKGLKRYNIILKKISNLQINSYDYMNFHGTSKISKIVDINLSYFSTAEERYVKIFLDKGFILADLIKRKMIISDKKNSNLINFKKINYRDTMLMQLKDIFKKNKIILVLIYKEKKF